MSSSPHKYKDPSTQIDARWAWEPNCDSNPLEVGIGSKMPVLTLWEARITVIPKPDEDKAVH